MSSLEKLPLRCWLVFQHFVLLLSCQRLCAEGIETSHAEDSTSEPGALVERVTPCAPFGSNFQTSGAHGVTRPTSRFAGTATEVSSKPDVAENEPPPLLPSAAAAESETRRLKFYWDDGLHYTVTLRKRLLEAVVGERQPERVFTGEFGARLQLDAAAYQADDDLKGFNDTAGIRRAQIYASGNFQLVVPAIYKIEFNADPDALYFENASLTFPGIPYIGTIKVGQLTVPFGMERITSSRDLTLMERASPIEALAPGINTGFQIGNTAISNRMTWAVGWFGGDDPEFGHTTASFTRVIGRVTGLPLYDPDEDNTRLVHVGLGLGYVFSFDGAAQISSRPESYFAPRLVDTGNFDADSAWGASLEAAFVHGPFSVQGEYLFISPDAVDGGSLFFHGFYAEGSWFLTGENRPYNTSQGVFGRVVPKRSLVADGGWGAFELAARFSYLDLDDGPIHGGKMTIPSAGLNWYLTKHVRAMFDYGFATADKSGEHSQVHIFQTRLQLDF